MRIDANNNWMGLGGAALQQQRASEPRPATYETDLAASKQLTQQIDKLPLVRTEKIAHAKDLLQDPSYPSDHTLAQIAGLLADRLSGSNG